MPKKGHQLIQAEVRGLRKCHPHLRSEQCVPPLYDQRCWTRPSVSERRCEGSGETRCRAHGFRRRATATSPASGMKKEREGGGPRVTTPLSVSARSARVPRSEKNFPERSVPHEVSSRRQQSPNDMEVSTFAASLSRVIEAIAGRARERGTSEIELSQWRSGIERLLHLFKNDAGQSNEYDVRWLTMRLEHLMTSGVSFPSTIPPSQKTHHQDP